MTYSLWNKEISLHPESWLCGYLPSMKNNSKRGKPLPPLFWFCTITQSLLLLRFTPCQYIGKRPPCVKYKGWAKQHTQQSHAVFSAYPGSSSRRQSSELLEHASGWQEERSKNMRPLKQGCRETDLTSLLGTRFHWAVESRWAWSTAWCKHANTTNDHCCQEDSMVGEVDPTDLLNEKLTSTHL